MHLNVHISFSHYQKRQTIDFNLIHICNSVLIMLSPFLYSPIDKKQNSTKPYIQREVFCYLMFVEIGR